MRQFDSIVFLYATCIEAAGIYINAIWITARDIKTFDAANLAKQVFGDAGVESVFGESILPAQ
jgi:hypothetical protein